MILHTTQRAGEPWLQCLRPTDVSCKSSIGSAQLQDGIQPVPHTLSTAGQTAGS